MAIRNERAEKLAEQLFSKNMVQSPTEIKLSMVGKVEPSLQEEVYNLLLEKSSEGARELLEEVWKVFINLNTIEVNKKKYQQTPPTIEQLGNDINVMNVLNNSMSWQKGKASDSMFTVMRALIIERFLEKITSDLQSEETSIADVCQSASINPAINQPKTEEIKMNANGTNNVNTPQQNVTAKQLFKSASPEAIACLVKGTAMVIVDYLKSTDFSTEAIKQMNDSDMNHENFKMFTQTKVKEFVDGQTLPSEIQPFVEQLLNEVNEQLWQHIENNVTSKELTNEQWKLFTKESCKLINFTTGNRITYIAEMVRQKQRCLTMDEIKEIEDSTFKQFNIFMFNSKQHNAPKPKWLRKLQDQYFEMSSDRGNVERIGYIY